MKFFFQNPFSIKKVLIFGGFGLCKFQHKVGMNSFPMCMKLFSYGTNSFPWGMYSFRSKIPIVNFVFNVKALAGTVNQEKALAGAFSVIVKNSVKVRLRL